MILSHPRSISTKVKIIQGQHHPRSRSSKIRWWQKNEAIAYELFTPEKIQGEYNMAPFVTSPSAPSIFMLLIILAGETLLDSSQFRVPTVRVVSPREKFWNPRCSVAQFEIFAWMEFHDFSRICWELNGIPWLIHAFPWQFFFHAFSCFPWLGTLTIAHGDNRRQHRPD